MDLWEILWRFGWLWSFLLSLICVWVGWSLNRKFVTHADCEARRKVDAQARQRFGVLLEEHARALTDLAGKINNMPSKDGMHALDLKLTRIEGKQETQSAEITALSDVLMRVENNVTLILRGHIKD